MKVTLGGDRLGAGKKEKIDIPEYGRSTHNLSYVFKTTASFGTLIPFACEVMLPGDDYEIDLDVELLTNPTIGPLFGSAKVGADMFTGDYRLYQGKLHNNLTGTGLNMKNIKLPIYELFGEYFEGSGLDNFIGSPDNISVNPSCVLRYLGLGGVGIQVSTEPATQEKRSFNAAGWIMYWDVIKNYYANQQEKIGAVIHSPAEALINLVTSIDIEGTVIPAYPGANPKIMEENTTITINKSPGVQPLYMILINTNMGQLSCEEIGTVILETGAAIYIEYDVSRWGRRTAYNWNTVDSRQLRTGQPRVQTFNLSEIDQMRENILANAGNPSPYLINNSAGAPGAALAPWKFILDSDVQDPDITRPRLASQEGLGLKTYMSDLFNNWLDTDWIDGTGGINDLTKIDTSGGSIEIDTINFAEKLYETLNRIVIAGNTYDDYLDAGYTAKRWTRPEIPVYHGGIIKELIFQEVVSQSESPINTEGVQPLGTLAGRGRLGSRQKGGSLNIKANEITTLMGLVHVTPRLDYSQGNKWDIHLKTMADFRLPGLDEIGFQELITEQMAWWDTYWDSSESVWKQSSAGKQPAWANYRTNVNRVFGNFAIEENQMWMVMNRRYTPSKDGNRFRIDDVTTYIDPVKFNWIFAQTALDAQNLWIQIAVNIKARRIMSARVIPNL